MRVFSQISAVLSIVRVQIWYNTRVKRILFVTSKPQPWFENQSCAEHFAHAPYSIDAIGYNLEKLGWTVGWMGRRSAASPFRVATRINGFKPDIVYTYGPTVALHPLAVRPFCRHRAFKVVHGWDDHYGRIWNELAGRPGKLLMDRVEKLIVKKSDAVATLSRALQNLGATWGVKCEYIPNGADPVDRESMRGTIRLEGKFNLVYTGDKARWKRTDDICRSMRELPNDVKLYMTGQEYGYLKPYLSGNCISLGWLSKEEQFNVMSQADAFVCTSDQDCNAKLQEYLRWRKPILAFDGEANLFFRNGHNALLAKNGEYAPLIRRLIEEPTLAETLASNAEREIPVYSWREIAGLFDAFFVKVLGQ